MAICTVDSPVGRLALECEGEVLASVRWLGMDESVRSQERSPLLREAARQLDRYFRRRLRRFELPLAARGTAFQQRVWQAMQEIPFGGTGTYGGLAMALGSGPRAVGMACGRNPIPVIVPCHRVLGAGGSEGGYSGGRGLPTKRQLLALEGVAVP